MEKAEWVWCPGVHESRVAHAMRDNCWSCAPWWEVYPVCPTHRLKLNETGYCKTCKRRYQYQTADAPK